MRVGSFFSIFSREASMKSEKREKEERKSKNENTRLRRWGTENLTVLPYLRTYFRGLNAIRKSCFETLHTASCVTRTVLDRLCSDAGSSGTLRRKKLLFVVTRLYCWAFFEIYTICILFPTLDSNFFIALNAFVWQKIVNISGEFFRFFWKSFFANSFVFSTNFGEKLSELVFTKFIRIYLV